MIIVLRPDATEEHLDHIVKKLKDLGLQAYISKGTERTIVGAIGDGAVLRTIPLEAFPGVENVLPILKPFKLASRDFRKENTVVRVGEAEIGGKRIAVMAGPCAVENKALMMTIAKGVKAAGANLLRVIPADKVKQGQKSLVGAMVVMPAGSSWSDLNSHASANVTLNNGKQAPDFMPVMTKDQNHRYADGFPVEHMNGEGAGIPEDSQENSNMALNYGIEPLWFRFAIPPNAPFGGAGCNAANGGGCYGSVPNAHQAYSNVLTAGADPVTPVFTASAGQEIRLNAAVPHTTSRGSTLAIHGHVWQRDPYVCPGEKQDGLPGKCNDADGGSFLKNGNPVVGSRAIGENPVGFAQGGRIDYCDERGSRRFENMLRETIFAATQQIRRQRGAAEWCVSVFEDNAGIVRFDDEFTVVFKVETHNHPSALEPYGGANTGVGGVIRAPMGTGLGVKPVCNTDVFWFAPPDTPLEALPPGVLHPRRVMKGVVAGVRDYGNRMGIPTVNGALFFDERYLGNPLVFCGNIGLIPRDKSRKQPQVGDWIVAVGGRTGRDGIHGATFSSAELTSESEVISGGAVQIGNAITEKMLIGRTVGGPRSDC